MAQNIETSEVYDFLAGEGEMATLVRGYDWASTSIGTPDQWPHSLKTMVKVMLTSRFAMWMAWGPDLIFFYNDSYRPTLGIKHPWALGKPASSVWAEIWDELEPRIDVVLKTSQATWDEGLLLFLERSGFPEETYHTFSYSPIPGDDGRTAGMLCVVTEETDRVIGERRLALLGDLASALSATNTEKDVAEAVKKSLEAQPQDLPIALLYLFDSSGESAHLATAVGITPGSKGAPERLNIGDDSADWPVQKLLESGTSVRVPDLTRIIPNPPTGPWDQPPREAILVPISQKTQERPTGFLVAGLNPYRAYGPSFSGLIELLVGQVAAGLSNAHAYEEERKRAEELAKLDRAKTTFFSNVSHELRTPLTLMLGPIEESIRNSTDERAADLEIAHRNGLRLLKLVNTLLDFSRIEAGRMTARFELTDLSDFTAQLASNFRSACDNAGIQLIVDCPPLTLRTYVDCEMWEKIVLNLISNALKHTFEGHIKVSLLEEKRQGLDAVVLRVSDTGTGIPKEAIPQLFERFFRVEGSKGRTHEGTGIGLSLVQELVQFHKGEVSVESAIGEGSTFTVRLLAGRQHLPNDRTFESSDRLPSSLMTASSFIEEALRSAPSVSLPDREMAVFRNDRPDQSPRILLADDNADMRTYISRLLAPKYSVETATHGFEALDAAHATRPDLIITDVMMPQLDGFGLLEKVRQDPSLNNVPVLMLSARAGEEARVEGLSRGADDYLVKPFSARELVARIQSILDLTELRNAALERENSLRQSAEEARERLELVLDGIQDYFMVLDQEWKCTFASSSMGRLFNLTEAEIRGRDFWDICPPERAQQLLEVMSAVRETKESRTLEVFNSHFGRWFEDRFYPIESGGVAMLVIDITDRIEAQRALRESKDRLQRFAEALPLIAWECEANGSVAWVNPRFAEYTGIQTDKPSVPDFERVICDEDRPIIAGAWRQAVTDGQEFIVEIRLRKYDDSMRWWLVRVAPERDENGATLRWYGSAVDIQDQKDVEHELERRVEERTAELLEANREMEGFTYSVSHDLRTPLRSIVFNSNVILEELGPQISDEYRDLLTRQSESARRLGKLIDDLLKHSRITRQEMKLEPVDLSQVARRTVDQLGLTPDNRLDFEIQDGVVAQADPKLIQFVISNLIENSVKFSPNGGHIQFGISQTHQGRTYFVSDEGVGFDETYVDKIFEPFERLVTEKEFPGTGIGLANVKRIVTRHRGSVWAKSRPGLGTTVFFTLAES